MKKIKVLFVLLVLLVLLLLIVLFNSKEKYIKDSDYLYDTAIDYLKLIDSQENNTDKLKEGYHFFITYEKLGITEKDNNKFAYMWVLGESYYKESDEVKKSGGYSMFYKFTFKGDMIIDIETTKDGSEYVDSVKKMCPDKKMEKRVLNYDMKLSLKKSVKDYYDDLLISFEKLDLDNNAYDEYLIKNEQIVYKKSNIKEIYYVSESGKKSLKEYIKDNENFDNIIENITDILELEHTAKDGGTKVYKSDVYDITLIRCNTVEKNKDIFIGDYNMQFDNLKMCQR